MHLVNLFSPNRCWWKFKFPSESNKEGIPSVKGKTVSLNKQTQRKWPLPWDWVLHCTSILYRISGQDNKGHNLPIHHWYGMQIIVDAVCFSSFPLVTKNNRLYLINTLLLLIYDTVYAIWHVLIEQRIQILARKTSRNKQLHTWWPSSADADLYIMSQLGLIQYCLIRFAVCHLRNGGVIPDIQINTDNYTLFLHSPFPHIMQTQ